MKKNIKTLILSVGIPLAGGALVGWLTSSRGNYNEMVKPPLSPPAWVFPAAWALLYILMGYALYRVLVSAAPKEQKNSALTVFAFQLALNYLWPVIFFIIDAYWGAVVCLVALIFLIGMTMRDFAKSDSLAPKLLLPYLLWCLFALYLNVGVAVLN